MYPCETGDDYLKSGLYYNTQPLENIYLINTAEGRSKYFYKSDLVFSTDGMYFAHHPWAGYNWDTGKGGVAIQFYKNGVLINQYYVDDLVSDTSVLIPSASHVSWENTRLRFFDAEVNTLSVTTLDGNTMVFDITSGEIISRIPEEGFPCCFCGKYSCSGHYRIFGELVPFPKVTVIILAIVFILLLFGIVVLIFWKIKKRKSTKK